MIRKTLDKYTVIELLGCLEELEIVDESGQLMARLIPDPAYREKMYAIARASIREEDLEVARRQKGGRTLAEIKQRLETLNGSLHGHVDAQAEDQLADQWLNSSDPNAVTQASDEIEQSLARTPSQFGESRSGDERLAFVPPLSVSFRVRESDRIVEVLVIGHS